MFNVFFKKSTRQHSSIRQVNSRGSIILMGIITLYDLKMLNDNPLHLQRQLNAFCYDLCKFLLDYCHII